VTKETSTDFFFSRKRVALAKDQETGFFLVSITAEVPKTSFSDIYGIKSVIMYFLALIVVGSAQVNEFPRWPDLFKQSFNETFKYPGGKEHYTTGTFYYNWEDRTYRVDRDNGRYDRYCGFNGMKQWKDTPCTQYVAGGDRFLFYPKLNECCYCCSAEHGCGILKPDWMTGASFIGIEDHNGVNSYKWDQKGLQHNYYFETVSEKSTDRVMLGIYQEPNDYQDFHLDRSIPNKSDFTLPSQCKKSTKCSLISTCTAVRSS
jgi:hypothetical protein